MRPQAAGRPRYVDRLMSAQAQGVPGTLPAWRGGHWRPCPGPRGPRGDPRGWPAQAPGSGPSACNGGAAAARTCVGGRGDAGGAAAPERGRPGAPGAGGRPPGVDALTLANGDAAAGLGGGAVAPGPGAERASGAEAPGAAGALAAPDEQASERRRRALVLARLLLTRGRAGEALAQVDAAAAGQPAAAGFASRAACDADVACLRGQCLAALGSRAEVRRAAGTPGRGRPRPHTGGNPRPVVGAAEARAMPQHRPLRLPSPAPGLGPRRPCRRYGSGTHTRETSGAASN